MRRLDKEGSDVTELVGLWDDSDVIEHEISLNTERILNEGNHTDTWINACCWIVKRYDFESNTYDIVFTPIGQALFHVACELPKQGSPCFNPWGFSSRN